MNIKNKVKKLKNVSTDVFLSWDFNDLKKSEGRNVTKLKNAILDKGFTSPVYVCELKEFNYVIDGTGRELAVKQLLDEGHTFESIPCAFVEAKNIKDAKQIVVQMNSTHGEITVEFIKLYIEDVDIDLSTVDIKGIDLKNILSVDEGEKEEDIPEPPKKAKTKKGDLYELGDHRVLCGDSTKLEDLERLMDGRKADMWLTYPPYNVNYTGKTKKALKIQNDKKDDSQFRQFLVDSFASADAVMKAGAVFYIWHADSEGYNFRGACIDVGWKVRQCLVWNKQNMVMGRQDYHWKHEPCLYGWKEGTHLWNSDRKQTTILNFDRPNRSGEHPTMKPVELMAYQMTNNTKGEDIILDSFLGSGSTLVAAETTGRICYGIELDEKYCDVIVERWCNLTGITSLHNTYSL